MVLYAPNLEEVGKGDGLEVYKKVWGALAYQLSTFTPSTVRLGHFLESLILIQYRAVDLLKKLCADVDSDRTWYDKGLHTKNIHVANLEAQGLEDFPE